MKRLMILALVGLVLMTAGCGGVILNAQYSMLLDETAALSAGLAKDAALGRMDPNDMKAALKYNADAWQCFQEGRDGVAKSK